MEHRNIAEQPLVLTKGCFYCQLEFGVTPTGTFRTSSANVNGSRRLPIRLFCDHIEMCRGVWNSVHGQEKISYVEAGHIIYCNNHFKFACRNFGFYDEYNANATEQK